MNQPMPAGGTVTAALPQSGIRMVAVRRIPVAKRALDVTLSAVGLALSAPLWLALAAAIKLEDGGDVFFGQERVGEGGRLFRALKFRSMVPDAEAAVGALQASEHDPRVTRIGRVMPLVRRTARFNRHRDVIVALLSHPPARRVLMRRVLGWSRTA